jgi:hypothetical protein
MNKQDIIAMAREAGATPYTNRHYPDRPTHTFTVEQLEHFFHMAQVTAVEQERKEFAVHAIDIARKAIEEEREACAKVCDDLDDDVPDGLAGWQYGEAIRARGETK